MSRYRIFETSQFVSDLDAVGKNQKNIIHDKLLNYVYPQLKQNPFFGPNIRKLVNYTPPTWRYRIGNYRVFYEIDQKEKIIALLAIETRQKAY